MALSTLHNQTMTHNTLTLPLHTTQQLLPTAAIDSSHSYRISAMGVSLSHRSCMNVYRSLVTLNLYGVGLSRLK